MKCKHAIIPVAGYGTRRLPVTKAVEKCMLPILNRPIIDYVIQDCIDAGINHIVVVVGEQSQQFQRYFGRDDALENYLREHGKEDYLPMISPPENVKFEFVTQPSQAPYGTATPVALARKKIPASCSAVVLMGDDFIYNPEGENPIKQLVENTPASESAILTTEVPLSEVSSYGVLKSDENSHLSVMVEKPAPQDAPSRMINISKYLFTPDLLDEIEKFYHEPPEANQEKFINVVPFERYAKSGGKMKVVRAEGEYLDVGTLEKWLHANAFIARSSGIENYDKLNN